VLKFPSRYYRKFLAPVTQHPHAKEIMTDEPKTSSENPAGTVSYTDSKAQKLADKQSSRFGGVVRLALGPRREKNIRRA